VKSIPEVDVYVRYCETDAGGHVNNTSYFLYFEEARTKFFSAIGFGPKEREHIHFIVARTECDFIAQAYGGQTLKVKTTVSKIGTKSYTMVHEIREAETEAIIAKGSAVIVCFNFQKQQSVTIPAELRTTLEAYLKITSGQTV
jgi:acyl-CoA thioester hydrolase